MIFATIDDAAAKASGGWKARFSIRQLYYNVRPYVLLHCGVALQYGHFCKTVFSQRLKRSGMAWSEAGGQRIVDLRVIHLSGVWSQVHQSYLQSKMLPAGPTQEGKAKGSPKKAA